MMGDNRSDDTGFPFRIFAARHDRTVNSGCASYVAWTKIRAW